jgi:FkbM family methyltransferase
MKDSLSTLNFVLEAIPLLWRHHSRNSSIYRYLDDLVRPAVQELYGRDSKCIAQLHKLGDIHLPFFGMGAIDSTQLFGLDELIIFSYYERNRHRYSKVGDLGANIGLHSICLKKLGYEVTAFEPDPDHLERIRLNCDLNGVSPKINASAVSTVDGEAEFTRVVGNTTGSHLSGAKEAPYGELDKFVVATTSFEKILVSHDLLKIDVEGHEATIISSASPSEWLTVDAIVEVGSKENAKIIHNHFARSEINLFAQSSSWAKVQTLTDMPTSYKDGSLFISAKKAMPW